MGSQNLRSKANYKMHKNRKKIWLEEIDRRILVLEKQTYNIGLSHIENILLPHECIESEGEDKYVFSSNHVFIQRQLSKMSSNLNYNIILAFNIETFNYFNLEAIRCPSLTNYVTNKIIPRILSDLKAEKRKNELALRIVEPTVEELKERNLRRIKNEDCRKSNETRRISIVPGKINYLKKHTIAEKNEKYLKLRDQNEKRFKEKISCIHIHIKNIGEKKEQNNNIPLYEEDSEKICGKLSPVQNTELPVIDSNSVDVDQDVRYSSSDGSEYSGYGDNEIDNDLVEYFRESSKHQLH